MHELRYECAKNEGDHFVLEIRNNYFKGNKGHLIVDKTNSFNEVKKEKKSIFLSLTLITEPIDNIVLMICVFEELF